MRIALFILTVILSVTFFTSGVSEANTCLLRENCKEECVKFNDKTYSEPVQVEDCKTVEVLSEEAIYCHIDESNNIICPPPIVTGEKINLKSVKGGNGLLAALADTFVWYTRGAASESYGGKSLSKDHGLPEFPNGRMLLIVDELVLSTETSQGDVESFTVYESKSRKPVALRINQNDKSIHIPSDGLVTGGRYTWRAVIDGKKYGGKFSIAKAKARKRFADALQESMKGSTNKESTRYFISAILARKKGYSFDAAQAIEASKRAKKGEVEQ